MELGPPFVDRRWELGCRRGFGLAAAPETKLSKIEGPKCGETETKQPDKGVHSSKTTSRRTRDKHLETVLQQLTTKISPSPNRF